MFFTDAYKMGHYNMYPEGLTKLTSCLVPRNTKYAIKPINPEDADKIVVFGISYLMGAIDSLELSLQLLSVDNDLREQSYELLKSAGLDFPKDKLEALQKYAKSDDSKLPIEIKALPEGTIVKAGTPILTITNTDPEHAWLVNWLETYILNTLWKPCTVATIAYQYRKLMAHYAQETVDDDKQGFIDYQCHDFSFRGLSGFNDAKITGAAHLTSFKGSDNLAALNLAYYTYPNLSLESVAATEHSVACSNILFKMAMNPNLSKLEAEKEFILDLIAKYPNGILSYVADTYDYWAVLTEIIPSIKNEIKARNGKFVIRPDSGNVIDILCGTISLIEWESSCKEQYGGDMPELTLSEVIENYIEDEIVDSVLEETEHGEPGVDEQEGYFRFKGKIYKVVVEFSWNRHDKKYYYLDGHEVRSYEQVELTAQELGTVEYLSGLFGGVVNSKGYKVLNEKIGVIYGDGVTYDTANDILKRLKSKGFASSNIVFGIGAVNYQFITRDTYGFAIKANSAVIDEKEISLYKDPATDPSKKSPLGAIKVVQTTEGIKFFDDRNKEDAKAYEEYPDLLQPVYSQFRPCFNGIRDKLKI